MRHMFNNVRRRSDAGFTLIELMVALIGMSVLATMVFYSLGDLYTDNISSLGKTTQSTSTLGVLQSIENDLASTSGWTTSLAVPVPLGPTNNTVNPETWNFCGTNGASDCNSSPNRVLIAYTNATDKAPTDATRLPVFANTAGNCDPNSPINTVKVAQIYFVAPDLTVANQNDLYRRTVVNPANDTICNGVTPYQKNSCAPSVMSQAGCKDSGGTAHQDAVLLTNVSAFNVDYYTAASDTSAIANEYSASQGTITGSKTIVVSVTSQVRINGTMTPNSANIRITRSY